MKRIAWILAAILSVVVLVAVLFFVFLPRETLKTRIGEQIAAWTGRDVSLRGEPEIDFFPKLTVTLKDVEIGGPDAMAEAEIVSMDSLTGTVRLLPLIIGEVEIESFSLVRPLIRLVREGDRRNWAFDSGAAALQLAFAGDVPLGNFSLEDGTFLYENRETGRMERLDSVNLSVNWPSVRQPLAISGFGIWRGEQVTFSSSAETPFAFLNGDATPFEARLDSVPIAMLFSGEAEGVGSPRISGALTMTTQSLRGFAAWLGSPIGPGSILGPASLAGAALLEDGVLSVEQAELTLDGNSAAGALKVTPGVRPDVTGTLAFPEIDLTPYFAGLSAAFSRGQDWRTIGLATDWFSDLTADIRLSADAVQVDQLAFGATAASVSLRDSRLEIGVAEAVFNGGRLTGNLAARDFPDTPDAAVEAQLRTMNVDLARAAPPLGLPQGLTGISAMAVDLAGRGATIGALIQGLSGTATIDVKNGSVPLFGIAEAAGAATRGGEPAAIDPALATGVNSLAAVFSFGMGTAVLEQATIISPSFSATAAGWVALADGTLALNGAVQAGQAPATPSPFTVEGTLAAPVARLAPLPPS